MSAFYNSRDRLSKRPNFQLGYVHFESNSSITQTTLSAVGFQQQLIDYMVETNKKRDVALILIIMLKPRSRGYVRLNGTSPYDKPEVVTNFLEDPQDIDDLVNALNQQQKLPQTKAFRKRGGEILRLPLPECDRYRYLSRAYQKCYVKYITTHCYHVSGTAKMGPKEDRKAVVDSRLRAHNVQRLRIIDASM